MRAGTINFARSSYELFAIGDHIHMLKMWMWIICWPTGFMLFLVSAPLKLSQVGVPWGSVYNGYIWYYYSIGSSLIVRPQKRIGTLNFTYMNLPFVVINLLIVCLSIAAHTMQGHTGCHKRVCLLWVYFVWYLWHPNAVACSVKENVWPWVFQWYCAAQQILCQHRCACHLVLVGSSLGAGSML